MANLNNRKIHRREYLRVIVQLGMHAQFESSQKESQMYTNRDDRSFDCKPLLFTLTPELNVFNRFSELFYYPGS